MWLDPLQAPGVPFCDVGCQSRLLATWGEQNQGRAKVFTGKHQQDGGAFIQREEPRLPGDRADNRFIVSSMHML